MDQRPRRSLDRSEGAWEGQGKRSLDAPVTSNCQSRPLSLGAPFPETVGALLLAGRGAHRVTLRPQQLSSRDSGARTETPQPPRPSGRITEAWTRQFPWFVQGMKLWSPVWSLADEAATLLLCPLTHSLLPSESSPLISRINRTPLSRVSGTRFRETHRPSSLTSE